LTINKKALLLQKIIKMVTPKIEQLLVQLEPKFLSQVQDYLEYLVFLQQQKRQPRAAAKNAQVQTQQHKLSALRRFKGDAPFPNISVSKSEVYEQ
jgi:hypothetical protein